MRVLITGSSGFLGRHLAAEFRRRGDAVLGIDIARHADDGYTLDVDCREWFAQNGDIQVDLVLHCAAVVGGRLGIEHDPLGVAVNMALDIALFDWATRVRPARVVYFSSSAAYPVALQDSHTITHWQLRDGTQRPVVVLNAYRLSEYDIDLRDPPSANIGIPDATYGWAKLTGEMLAGHARDQGVNVHVVRPFSGYGTDQSPDYPFRAFLDRARRREDPFRVWGDGTQVRDWVHVDDIVAAVLAVVEQDIPGPLNICTGRPTSFDQLAEYVTAAAGYSPAIEHVLDAPRGVSYRVGDPSALHRVYKPVVSLEEGIQRALDMETPARP